MVAATPAPPIRTARIALFAVFGLNGMLSALWIVHIPAVTQRAGVSHSALGVLILLMAGCAIVGMQAAGPLADRLGSRTLTATAATILSVALIGPGLATSPGTLAIALAAFGFGNGMLDVSMNAQAVHIERAYPRPIMSAFHACFSLGGLLGSLAGAATQRAHWNIHTTLLLSAALGLTLVALCTPRLLPHQPTPTTRTPPDRDPQTAESGTPQQRFSAQATAGAHDTYDAPAESGQQRIGEHNNLGATGASSESEVPAAPDRRALRHSTEGLAAERRAATGTTRKVLVLGAIAFAVLMAEGVAADWSALQLRDRLGVEVGTAALAYGAFSTTMTAGRLVADRVSGRFGRVAVVRWGTVLGAGGFGLIAISGWLPLTLAGWALCGIGLSGAVPQVFTAAGNLGSANSATDMSRVFGLGYVGLLAGPAIIGWLTTVVPLTTAMVVPLIALLLCAWGARVVGTH
ncbi:MAG: Membrane protein MosC [Nocardia sp.]|uniref:MFS transporter n=1 Tax=Nocardia sp. TaxID=1821 RepID=UPI0026052EF1|nr:MFS transporter [Nocardia sp.]MCU1644768.1 Membrane protein MosC [Nocardia sp.]